MTIRHGPFAKDLLPTLPFLSSATMLSQVWSANSFVLYLYEKRFFNKQSPLDLCKTWSKKWMFCVIVEQSPKLQHLAIKHP